MSQNLRTVAEKFLDLKNKFMDQKLSESDAAILAAKMLEMPGSGPSSQFYDIKQSDRFSPYLFVGTGLVIKKIEVRTGTEANLSVVISVKQGLRQNDIKLLKNQALWFLTLLSLKFKEFESDATGGFEQEIDFESAELAKKMGINFRTLSNDDYENLKRKLSEFDFNQSLQKANRKTRLSVPPNHIAFSKDAKDFFETLTTDALYRFEQRYTDVLTA